MRSPVQVLAAIAVVWALAVALRAPYVFASTPTPVPAAGTTDRDALVALYHATDGDNWTNNENWLSDAPLNRWYGVTTDEGGRVIELNLWQNGLHGTIPTELGSLVTLNILNLFDNQLRGEIPPELGNLRSLIVLNLSQNELRGAIPLAFSNLAILVVLDLSNNQLSGMIPSELGKLSYLAGLYLSENKLHGTIPSNIGELTNLEELGLYSNQLSGTIPIELGNLINLKFLALADNKLNGTIPSELGNLVGLEQLVLSTNQLSGTIPATLNNLANLTALGLNSNQLGGIVPPGLGKLINLQALSLSNNQFLGTIPPELGNLTALKWLWLSENQLTGTIPPELGNLTNLEMLHLWSNELTGTIPRELGSLTNLTELAAGDNRLTGTIPPELGNLTNLTVLGLYSNQLSGRVPLELGTLINLQALSLWENQLSGAIPSELGNLTNLEKLLLSDNQLSGTIPLELGELTNLDELYLSGNGLKGCLPVVWKNVEENDLDQLGLPFCIESSSAHFETTDRDALAAFYQATDGDNWTNNENWLSDAPLNSWYGVTTDESDRVIALDLGGNRLSGTIPPQLGNLINLEWLALWGNKLSGTIPSELGNLTKLEWLNLSENQFNGTIPSELGNLTRLESLYLWGNQLEGMIPPELDNLTSLEWLDLSENQLSGPIPSGLGDLINLGWLYLQSNRLSGSIPPELGNLINLWVQNLSENRLTGAIPPELAKLIELRWLVLSENLLSGSIPSELANLSNLAVLNFEDNLLIGTVPPDFDKLTELGGWYLSGNRLDGCLPAGWEDVEANDFDELGLIFCGAPSPPSSAATDRDVLIALYRSTNGDYWTYNSNWLSDAPLNTWHGVTTDENGRVTRLELSYNGLSGTIPSELGTLLHLERLLLNGNNLSGQIPPELGSLIKLTGLSLCCNSLSGTIPLELGNLINLSFLSLNDNQLEGVIPSELGNLTNLTSLSLFSNQLRGTIPLELGKLTNLTELSLDSNQLHGTIPPELGNLTDLAVLWLDSNQLYGTIPPELGNLTELLELSLSGNQLSGCVPAAWRNVVVESDLDLLGLPYCGPLSPQHTVAALIAFYRSTNGDSWINNSNWLSDGSLNAWHGVITDEEGRVTGLELPYNGLSGTIPSELGALVQLEKLHLHGNELSGEIPPELGELTNLKRLSLWNNQLEGTIPAELGNLTNLVVLYVDSNRLRGTVPPEMGNLTNLAVLWLASNQLKGAIPPELGNLSELVGLRLSGNQFSGCVPAAWRNVGESDVGELGLSYCAAPSSPSAAVPEKDTAAQILSNISPAVVFVQTETGSGSGLFVEGGYVLTNAHVVWPFHGARVVFPDGTAFDQAPLKGWDLLADLALFGPIDAPVQPLALVDGEDVPIGSDVYFIGYPAEAEVFSQPTIASGILSRLREWMPAGMTYFQTDAAIDDGQSGGALISDEGGVIGFGGYTTSDGQFALVASAADLLPRIRELIAGGDPSGLGERRLPLQGGSPRQELVSDSFWSTYIVNQPAGTAVEVALSGAENDRFLLFDLYGNELTDGGTTSFSYVTQNGGPHFLIFTQVSEQSALTANHPFIQFSDPDQGREIRVGQSLFGNIDFPVDFDFFILHLEQGEAVEVVARSVLADPFLVISHLEAPGEEWIEDDDSGGGLFGLDARILFQAPYTGRYVLYVYDDFDIAPGGYIISVARAESEDMPATSVPTATIGRRMNVREGPGTNYAVVGTAGPGEQYRITGKSPGSGDWWQIKYEGGSAWVYGPLVTATDAENVQVADPPAP